jgi:hypothetical protein
MRCPPARVGYAIACTKAVQNVMAVTGVTSRIVAQPGERGGGRGKTAIFPMIFHFRRRS